MESNTTEDFLKALRAWMEASMQVSMRSMIRYTREIGITIPQVMCLFRLAKRGSLQVSQISESLSVSVAAASQMLDKMVQQGFIRRWDDPDDRRVRHHGIDTGGKKLIEELFRRQTAPFENIATAIPEKDRTNYALMLKNLTEKTGEILQQAPFHRGPEHDKGDSQKC